MIAFLVINITDKVKYTLVFDNNKEATEYLITLAHVNKTPTPPHHDTIAVLSYCCNIENSYYDRITYWYGQQIILHNLDYLLYLNDIVKDLGVLKRIPNDKGGYKYVYY